MNNGINDTKIKKDKYMKGWNVGQPMTYSEIDRLIKMVQDEIKIRIVG